MLTIDFTSNFDTALAKLRDYALWLATPAGILQTMEDRLLDAERDLPRAASESDRARIEAEIAQLQADIARQKPIAADPIAAEQRAQEAIERGLERERQPERPVSGGHHSKFINPPPAIAPNYFQDRSFETKQVADFLNDDSQRLMTIVGRGGVGKTAMICRLLKGLENGKLPDDLGEMRVDGIVYLSAVGSRRVNFPNLYADLSKLLPQAAADELDALYKNPQVAAAAKMDALLGYFPSRRVVLLLDNFEDAVDAETRDISDGELNEALEALLNAPHHAVKVVITTRLAPRKLALVQPGRQRLLELDEGLTSPFAENILRAMDADGKLGLKTASDALLAQARERTRGYPRALEALAAILSADRETTLEDLLTGVSVGAVREPPLQQPSLPENVVDALVGQAFNRLDPAAQKVMQALAIYGRPVPPVAVDYLLQPYLPGIDSAPALGRLVGMHFARRESGRYYLHPVDRTYALSRIERGDRDAAAVGAVREPPLQFPSYAQIALFDRAADYFKQARKLRSEWKTIQDLAPQLSEFDLRCEGGDWDTAAGVLLDIDFDYLLLWGHFRLMAEFHQGLQGKLSDTDLKHRSAGNLGRAYFSMGRIGDAITHFEIALVSARESKNRWGEGAWLGGLGSAYRDLGEMQRAIGFYDQALAIARDAGDKWAEGAWLGNLGLAYRDLGEMQRAIGFYEQALAIAREIGDKRNEGGWLGNLGLAYRAQGEMQRAIGFYEQALAIAREIGDKRNEGVWLGSLGSASHIQGEVQRAMGFYEQALAIAREVSDRWGEGAWLGNLALCFIDEGAYDEAVKYALQAIKIAEDTRSSASSSYCNYALAVSYLYSGDLPAARAAAEAARRYDVPQNNHNILALLGLIVLRQGEEDAARAAFAEAVTRADALLAQTPELYDALDAKGLALSGLALCAAGDNAGRGGSRTAPTDIAHQAIAAYRAARAITTAPGIVARTLRLFDALAQADTQGLLSGVRQAASGEQKG